MWPFEHKVDLIHSCEKGLDLLQHAVAPGPIVGGEVLHLVECGSMWEHMGAYGCWMDEGHGERCAQGMQRSNASQYMITTGHLPLTATQLGLRGGSDAPSKPYEHPPPQHPTLAGP